MAAKKNFTDALNPATMFISAAQPQQAEPEAAPASSRGLKASDAPEGYRVNPAFIETKSKRFNMLIQPSLLAKVKAKAAQQGLSTNEYIHSVLEEATRED